MFYKYDKGALFQVGNNSDRLRDADKMMWRIWRCKGEREGVEREDGQVFDLRQKKGPE